MVGTEKSKKRKDMVIKAADTNFIQKGIKPLATFLLEVHFKPLTNLELSNALAHDAKLVLSFITGRKCRDPRDPLRSQITLRALPLISFTA